MNDERPYDKVLKLGTDACEGGGDFVDASLEMDDSGVELTLRLTEAQTRNLRDILNDGLGE